MKDLPYHSREIKLLLLLSRSELNSEQNLAVQGLLNQSLNWSYILEIAQKRKLAPLVFANLSGKYAHQTDESNYKLLKKILERYIRSNLLLTQSMIQLVNHFKGKGLTLIPFKGPVLSHIAYQKPFHRYFEDLDFLVSKNQFPRVCNEFLELGLVGNYLNDPDYYRQSQFAARQTQMVLDLHYALTPTDCFIQIDTDRLISDLQPTVVNGSEVETFSVEDLLIILCVDAAKGYWRSIIRLVDISELLRKQNVDWQKLELRARSLSALSLVEMGLMLTKKLLDAPVPEDLKFLHRSSVQLSVDEATLHQQVFKLNVDCQQSIQWHRLNMQTLNSIGENLKYFYRLSKFSMRNIPLIKEKIRT